MAVIIENSIQPHVHSLEASERHDMIAKPLALIQSWSVVEDVVSPRFTVLQPGKRLIGHVLGLAHLPYAKLVHTSPIQKVDLAHGLVETRNTIYRLGEASEEYDSWRTISYRSDPTEDF